MQESMEDTTQKKVRSTTKQQESAFFIAIASTTGAFQITPRFVQN